jgi:ubiquinone biosynthesis monooxygenase Coq7
VIPPLPDPDRLIAGFDRALRTLFAPARPVRPVPGEDLPEAGLGEAERRHAAALMRVNHTGEICAQALYQGQAMTARDPRAREALQRAADEEMEHLAWTSRRVGELGGRLSLLNPLFYAGAFTMGALSGLRGDAWNLGFLAETERQVEGHLESHLDRLPEDDARSRAIVGAMKEDEARHAASAVQLGAAELPAPVKQAMRLASKVMTGSTYWV